MKVKTADLIGHSLDWAAAKSEGIRAAIIPTQVSGVLHCYRLSAVGNRGGRYCPSSWWSEGGPIIEREGVSLRQEADPAYRGQWIAEHRSYKYGVNGPTALIAAVRCCVASKLGDEVDIPETLG